MSTTVRWLLLTTATAPGTTTKQERLSALLTQYTTQWSQIISEESFLLYPTALRNLEFRRNFVSRHRSFKKNVQANN